MKIQWKPRSLGGSTLIRWWLELRTTLSCPMCGGPAKPYWNRLEYHCYEAGRDIGLIDAYALRQDALTFSVEGV